MITIEEIKSNPILLLYYPNLSYEIQRELLFDKSIISEKYIFLTDNRRYIKYINNLDDRVLNDILDDRNISTNFHYFNESTYKKICNDKNLIIKILRNCILRYPWNIANITNENNQFNEIYNILSVEEKEELILFALKHDGSLLTQFKDDLTDDRILATFNKHEKESETGTIKCIEYLNIVSKNGTILTNAYTYNKTTIETLMNFLIRNKEFKIYNIDSYDWYFKLAKVFIDIIVHTADKKMFETWTKECPLHCANFYIAVPSRRVAMLKNNIDILKYLSINEKDLEKYIPTPEEIKYVQEYYNNKQNKEEES